MFENLVENIQGYKKPLAFGIARVDLGQLNHDKVLQATYPVINWNENFGTAAVFIRSLFENGIEVTVGAMSFSFLGGSVGIHEGNTILAGVNSAIENKTPLIFFPEG
jgi:hypothetical protein